MRNVLFVAVPGIRRSKRSAFLIVALVGAMLFVLTSAWALTAEEEAKLLASDGAAGDGFGATVSLDGDTALIGASRNDDNGSNSGSAYVFTRTAGVWTEQAKLLASDGAAEDHFGHVSLDGDTAIIGALFDDDKGEQAGSAYVFTRTGSVWTEQAKLLASDGAADDNFGGGVSLDGDTALIGAYRDDDNGSNSGSAYVFTRTAGVWTQQAKLLASDGSNNSGFGVSVSLAGDTTIIGAPWSGGRGSAYVFTRTAGVWTEQAKLLDSYGANGDNFGVSVSLDGDTALIGAQRDGDDGSAYVFTRTAGVWTEQAKLLASDGAAEELFGGSVSIDGDTAIIGAKWDDDNGEQAGSAYLFTRTAGVWTKQAKLLASDGAGEDWFGGGVSLDGDTAIIGAFWDDDNGPDSGSAYAFRLLPDEEIPAVGGFGALLTLLAVAGIGFYFLRRGAH